MTKLLDILGGADTFKSIVLSWFTPIALAVFSFTLVLGPQIQASWLGDQFITALDRLEINRALALILVSAWVAALSYVIRDNLYRILEGYSWPDFLREWRVNRSHKPHALYLKRLRQYLQAREHEDSLDYPLSDYEEELDKADQARKRRGRESRWSSFLRRRRPLFVPRDKGRSTRHVNDLPPYPSEDDVRPTNFGNRMRYFERYGYRTYGLDSQTW